MVNPMMDHLKDQMDCPLQKEAAVVVADCPIRFLPHQVEERAEVVERPIHRLLKGGAATAFFARLLLEGTAEKRSCCHHRS